jgi:hypothetical protein
MPASSVDAAISNFRDRVLPSLRTQAGFLGAVAAYDGENGEGVTAGYWETKAALEATRPMAAAGRAEASQLPGVAIVDVDELEILLQDRVATPRANTFLRGTDLKGAPDKIDAALALLRDTGLPAVKARPGYRALIVLANRATGRMIITSSWETAAERGPADRGADLRKRILEAAGASEARVALAEVLLSELSAAVQSAGSAAPASS